MKIDSLDPRVSRLKISADNSDFRPLANLDDLTTYQVFVRLKDKRPLLHVGIVHGPDLEIAFMHAKEQYSRRLTCTELWVVPTAQVICSDYAFVGESVYELEYSAADLDNIELPGVDLSNVSSFEIFHQSKRGVQQKHVGSVEATSLSGAFLKAKEAFANLPKAPAVSIWLSPSNAFRKSTEDEKEIWNMLDEKRYRDAIVYKVKHKIDAYKEKVRSNA